MIRALLPAIDRTARIPLAAQIADFYAERIRDAGLRPGDRLPPIRQVAESCDVTRATVAEAYRLLAGNGLVESVVGRGTTVLPLAIDRQEAEAAGVQEPRGDSLSPYARAALRQMREMPGAPPLPAGRALVANFAELAPDGDLYPVDEWRAAMDAVLQRDGGGLLGYGHASQGLPELRALLAERWHDRQRPVGPDDILVTAGAQQALDLVLRTFCAPGDEVVVTTPSYHQMSGLLRAHGLDVLAVPFGPEGLDLARLEQLLHRPTVRLLYLMPTFHNPTGQSLGLQERRALVEMLACTDVPVVEDEYQFALRFRGEPLPSLRSLDERDLTVTVATTSKDLFPALRLGWVMGSAGLLAPMTAVKRFMDLETSALLQAALVEFVKRGSLDRHLEVMRGELRVRHDALQAACRKNLPAGCRITEPDGGFVAWLELPQPGQGEQLAELALERGVRVVPGRVFDLHGRPSRGARLSLTRADAQQITAGIAVLGDCVRELLASPLAARPFL